MATIAFYRGGLTCGIIALICMFIAFASPFWYQSWTRVHSSFGNIGLWHVCLNGYIMPRDPIMKSYVGCWWIHSSEFDKVKDDIQPVWFRFIQAFSVFTLLMDLLAVAFAACYNFEETRVRLYQKRPRMFFIISVLLLGSAFLVFLISLVFAEKSLDDAWMPRPWMNYLSWSYGLCVLSGFFAAFGGMCFFILALVFKDKEENGDPGVISAAELAAKKRALEKQDEMVREGGGMQMEPPKYGQYGSGSVASGPARSAYHGSGSVAHQRQVAAGHHGSGQIGPRAGQQYPMPHHQHAAISVHAPHHGSGSSIGVRPPPPQYGSGNVYRPGGMQGPAVISPSSNYQQQPAASSQYKPSRGPPSVAESQGSHAPESAV